jgi:hypothetical protein
MAHRNRWVAACLAMAAWTTVDVASAEVAAAFGTYRLHGTANVDAKPMLDRTVEVHADAVLKPGRGPAREVVVTVAAEGGACDLTALIDEAGALEFRRDQQCAVEIHSPDARGHLDAVLRSGRGQVRGEQLELSLSFGVQGVMSVRTADRVEVLGREVEIPAAWTPETPLRGQADASLLGTRDRSRAAQGGGSTRSRQ